MDVRKLKYSNSSFDFIVDKSTIDALLCGENSYLNVAIMLKEVQRVLKVNSYYMIISYGKPENRIPHLERAHLDFDISVYTIKKDVDDNPDLNKIHYVYLCKKKEGADLASEKNYDFVLYELEQQELMEKELIDDEEEEEEIQEEPDDDNYVYSNNLIEEEQYDYYPKIESKYSTYVNRYSDDMYKNYNFNDYINHKDLNEKNFDNYTSQKLSDSLKKVNSNLDSLKPDTMKEYNYYQNLLEGEKLFTNYKNEFKSDYKNDFKEKRFEKDDNKNIFNKGSKDSSLKEAAKLVLPNIFSKSSNIKK